MIPKSFLDELNGRVNLPSFIGQYVPALKKKGGDTYSAPCPFHEEKTGSFTVSERKGFYHCFGCGAHGDGIRFLMDKNGMAFHDAVEEVAQFVGMQVPKEDRPEKTKQEKEEAGRYMKAISALGESQAIYAKLLSENIEAMEYLAERGVTNESIVKFGLGYAPDAWNAITGNKNFSKETLEDAGLSTKKDTSSTHTYDRFRDRITFPIYGKKDAVIGFGCRAIHNQDPKYLNSPETLVFKKGTNLYGLSQAQAKIQAQGRVFVVEGYMDVLMLSQYGVENTVASLGTAVTIEQMRKLFTLCSHITFCMDGDKPGRAAAWKAAENILPLLDDSHKIDFLFIPDEQDPDDFVKQHGKKAFDDLALNALTLTDYILGVFVRFTNFQNGESLAKYLVKSNEMADKIEHSMIRLSFQKRIAEEANISLDTMLQMLNEQKEKQRLKQPIKTDAAQENKKEEGVQTQVAIPKDGRKSVDISVAAKIIGIAVLKDKSLAQKLEIEFINKFLSHADREMLFPLLAYIKANVTADDKALLDTLSFNPHAKLINSLLLSASLVGENFNAEAEAKLILDSFRRMGRIYEIVHQSQAKEKVLMAG